MSEATNAPKITLSDVHKYFSDGYVEQDGKKVPANGYSLARFRDDWKALSVDEKEWFKNAVAAVSGE